jgi:hypothetical protein
MQTIDLGTKELLALSPEPGARCCYVVTCRDGAFVLCTQRLPPAIAWVNENAAVDRVSTASMYEAANLGRLVHRRFAVARTTREGAVELFAQARRAAPNARALVLGHRFRVRFSD